MYRKLSQALNKSSDSNAIENAFKSEDIIKQGYLCKQSAHLKAVRKRWMVLKRDCFYSYKKPKSPTETFEFAVYDSIHTLDGPLKFELISSSTPHSRTFIANSEKERNEWVDVIKEIQSNRMYKSWNYNKSLKAKSKKAKKLGYKKANIATAFMNKGHEIHNPTDDSISDESDDNESNANLFNPAAQNEVHHNPTDNIVNIQQQNIVEELAKFGYCKGDSIEAIQNVTNKNDINSIAEYIDNKAYDTDICVMDGIPETSNLSNPKQWELVLNLMTSDMQAEQQLLIYLKLKILAEGLIHTHDPKARTLSLKKSKLQQTVLKLNGGLVFLYQLGFEHDALCYDTLICDKKFNCNAVNACIQYLEDKMQFLKANVDFDRYRAGTVTDNIIAIANPAQAASINEMVCNPTDEMIDDMDINEQNVLSIHNPTDDVDETQNMSGKSKQFYNFLNENNLEEYFDSFKKNGCCHIKDIEYLVDDDDKFLEKNIGIKNVFHRKKLIGESKKLKAKMHDFEENVLMPPVIKKRLSNQGVVTMDILMDEIESRSELETKLGIDNDLHCELLWNIISSQSNTPRAEYEDEEYHTHSAMQHMEGVESVAITPKQTNYIAR